MCARVHLGTTKDCLGTFRRCRCVRPLLRVCLFLQQACTQPPPSILRQLCFGRAVCKKQAVNLLEPPCLLRTTHGKACGSTPSPPMHGTGGTSQVLCPRSFLGQRGCTATTRELSLVGPMAGKRSTRPGTPPTVLGTSRSVCWLGGGVCLAPASNNLTAPVSFRCVSLLFRIFT